jgi:hypothetical protein
VQKTLLRRLWENVKFLALVVIASLLGITLAGYPGSPRDSFLGSLVAPQPTARGAKLNFHKRWQPYNPLRIEKEHSEEAQEPKRPE